MDTPSGVAGIMNFSNTKGSDDIEQNNKPTIVEEDKPSVSFAEEEKRKLDEPYIENKYITIALCKNYSKFREANRSALPKRVDYIGSCIATSRMLASVKGEMDAYFPQIIGLSPSDPDFVRRVKLYLNNIQIKIDELGKTFNASFVYDHYRDYLKIREQEQAIENRYKVVNKQNLQELSKAIKRKVEELNTLESTKYKYGHPVNVEDYIIYRHCLLYNDIAKDTALINSSVNIRFYFKDEQKEADKARKLRTEMNKAKSNFVACMADDKLFEAVYIQYLSASNLPITSSLLEDEITRQDKLDRFSQQEPVKFNKWCTDRDIKLKSTIELLIARGLIIRSTYNQNITTTDGTLIGANMLETIGWFKDPVNTAQVEAYYNQLKNI